MTLTIYTDGGSLNNPGQAAYAFIVCADGKVLHKQNERIGIASNNVAEYTALIRAFEYVKEHFFSRHSGLDPESKIFMDPRLREDDIEGMKVVSDSLLMVNQVNGLFKVKNANIKDLHTKVKFLEMELGLPIAYSHVLREKNEEADALVKEALRAV